MNWKTLTDTITPYVAKIDPYLTQAKEYSKKATEFVEQQVQTTPLFIKNQAEYDAIVTEKRLLLIAYDPTHPVSQDVRIFSPIWITRAFMDNAALRFIDSVTTKDLHLITELSDPIDMRVYYMGSQIYHFTNITDIKKWWQDPIYQQKEALVTPNPIDPLSIV